MVRANIPVTPTARSAVRPVDRDLARRRPRYSALNSVVAVGLIGMGMAFTSHAAPSGSGDDMDQFLAEKGLLSQLSEAGQSVTQRVARNVTEKASELVVTAMGFLGVPYKRGGNSFETGFDCSGFVRALYEQSAGLLLPRKAEQQAAATVQIDKTELQPGDLVFFNTLKKAFSHVGIYVGDGKFIHSPRAGSAVRVEDMQKAYWTQRFDGARRVEPARQATTD
jgi:cell wall-associated NlpC family hydrolase